MTDEKTTLKPGDVFETSWGYDQTNYDFIVVVSVSPTGKTAICKRACVHYCPEDSTTGQDALAPTTESYGLPFRMQVKVYDGKPYLRGSYPYLSRFEDFWDEAEQKRWLESTRLDGFSPVDNGRKYYQTNPMFGH